MKIKTTLLLLPLLIGSASSAWSQTATAPYSRKATNPTAYTSYQGARTNSIVPAITSLFQWGPILLKPHFDYRYAEASGLNATETSRNNDTTIQTFSPGINFLIGEHWTLDYTSRWTYYTESAFEDARDDVLSISGWAQTANWNIGLRHSYQTDSSTLVETGVQTSTKNFNTDLTATTQLSRALGLETSLTTSIRTAEGYSDSRTISTLEWLRYENSQRLNTSFGLGAGYSEIKDGVDSSFQNFLLRATLKLTQKIDLSVNGGVETRQFKIDGSNNLSTPIYSASLKYNPFEQTTLSIDAGRSVGVSIFEESVSESQYWSLNFNQRLLGRYLFSFTNTNRDADYISNTGDHDVERSNEFVSYNYKISTDIFENGKIAIFYHSSNNEGSDDSFAFSSHESGIEISYDF